MPARDDYGLCLGDILFVIDGALHPLICLSPPKQPEFVSAPARDAAEHLSGKLIVILELQPVNQTLPVAVGMHGMEQCRTVQRSKGIWPEPDPKRCIARLKPVR